MSEVDFCLKAVPHRALNESLKSDVYTTIKQIKTGMFRLTWLPSWLKDQLTLVVVESYLHNSICDISKDYYCVLSLLLLYILFRVTLLNIKIFWTYYNRLVHVKEHYGTLLSIWALFVANISR